MELKLNEGEQIYYSRDYSKGRKKSTGNVTVTDERIVRTIESKYGVRKTEISLDETSGVKMKFKSAKVWLFILAGVYALFGVAYNLFMDKMYGGGAGMGPDGVISSTPVPAGVETLQIVVSAVSYGLMFINFILGLLSLRNGFYIVIGTKNSACFDLVTATDYLGGLKPLILKTKRDVAFQMMSEISAAILDAKAKSRQN